MYSIKKSQILKKYTLKKQKTAFVKTKTVSSINFISLSH